MDLKCSYCNKSCKNENSLRNHERLCKLNPLRKDDYLYKKTDKWYKSMEVLKKKGGANQFIKAKELGLDVPVSKCKGSKREGKKHSEETKNKISQSMKKIYEGKSRWYIKLEKRKSYAEQYFIEIFPSLKNNYHVSRFFLDFANPDLKTYFEVDGEQHYNDKKVIEHDLKRTQILKEEGWTLLKRIRWSEYQKLSIYEKENLIKLLKYNMYN